MQEGDGIDNPGESPGKPTTELELDARLWLMAEGAVSSAAEARAPHYAAFARYAIAKRDHLAQGEQSCCDRAAQEMEAKMDEELRAVRMEAQTLREANVQWDYTCQKLTGWIQWRQAWTGGSDPRDLSGTRWDICALRGDAPPRGFMGCTVPSGTPWPLLANPSPGAATVAEPRTDRAKTCDGAAGSTPAPGATDPRLADAEVLERAAEILRKRGCLTTEGVILEQAAELRAAAPAPARDWADEVADDINEENYSGPLSDFLSVRFGPLVEHAEEDLRGDGPSGRKAKARAALRALRGGGA